MLKHGILGILNYADMTGYEINQIFQDSLNYFWVAQTSQIYRELQNLKKQGWVSFEEVEQKQRPEKKVFSITESGKEELINWLLNSDVNFPQRNEILMKVFFLGELNNEKIKDFFTDVIKKAKNIKKDLGKTNEIIENYKERTNRKNAILWEMTADYGIMYMEMVEKWAKSCIKKMEEK